MEKKKENNLPKPKLADLTFIVLIKPPFSQGNV